MEYATIVMGVLGYKVFEPLTEKNPGSAIPEDEILEINVDNKKDSVSAKGIRTREGFVLLKGSKIKGTLTPSLQESIKTLRVRYKEKINSADMLQEDILLRSPHEVACFVLGRQTNALITMGYLRRKNAERTGF